MRKPSKKFQILIGLIIFVILLVVLYFTGILNLFSLANLKAHRQELLYFVANHYAIAVIGYLVATILIVATTLPLAAFIMILAGLLFGLKWGAVYANIGATIGAGISFIWLRYAFRETVPEKLKTKLESFNRKIEQHGAFYFLSLHLMSVLPFFLINALAVMAHISLFTFCWTTSLGIIPISLLYTYVGQRLGEIDAIGQVLTRPVMGAFFGLALIAILPVLIAKIKKVVKRN